MLHEIAHGLGFLSTVNLATGAKLQGLDDAYMRLLENHATGLLFPTMTDAERFAASRAGANLHWTGAEAITCGNSALTSGRDPATGHIEMFAPNPAQPGSSVSHFNTSLTPNQLMEPSFTETLLNLNAVVDPCLLVDLGWTIAPPTPPPPPPPPPAGVTCNGLPATIVGTPGSETIIGTAGDDVIHGLGGNDLIRGLAGKDVICGGSGKDKLFGNQNRDKLFGQTGNDAMNGGSGSDRCNGGPGTDTAVNC